MTAAYRVLYLDTSAAAKLLVAERESVALAAYLDDTDATLASCFLLETELRRMVPRIPALTQEMVTTVLDGIDLYEMPPSIFREAGLLTGKNLRSLDAIHLAAAIRLGVDAVITYDLRMAEAARRVGITPVAPR